jgi:phage gp46-like protein
MATHGALSYLMSLNVGDASAHLGNLKAEQSTNQVLISFFTFISQCQPHQFWSQLVKQNSINSQMHLHDQVKLHKLQDSVTEQGHVIHDKQTIVSSLQQQQNVAQTAIRT